MKRLLSIVLSIVCVAATAQNVRTQRIELQDKDKEHIRCIPFDSSGFILQSIDDGKQTSRKLRTYTFTKYDTALAQSAAAELSLPARKSAYLTYKNNDSFYLLAYQTSGSYTLSIVSGRTMETRRLSGKLPKNSVITTMRAVGDHVYLLGRAKDMPLLVIHNTKTNELTFGKIIPLNKRRFSIASFDTNEDTGEMYLFTKDILKNDRLVKMHVYKDGEKTYETIIKSPHPDKYIVSASASRLEDGSFFVTGTYGNTERNNDISVGLFLMKQENGVSVSTKFINYLDIKNFNCHLSEKRQERIEKKQERMQSQDKELELNYLMTPHKMIEQDGRFTLIGEVYYPTFRQECDYYPTASGLSSMLCRQVFDGYQYTHFFLICFDADANIVWSNAAPMTIDEKPFLPIHFLSVSKRTKELQTVYSSFNKLHINNFADGEKTFSDEIVFVEENEKLLYSLSKNQHWYGNVFLSYGGQHIKNKDERAKRHIFFIEKISIEE